MITEEMNTKLGARIGTVTFQSEGQSFSIVADGSRCKLTVVVTSNLPAHRIDVTASKTGAQTGDETTSYPIVVSKLDHLGVDHAGTHNVHL